MLQQIFEALFGTKSEREIKFYFPNVTKILDVWELYMSIRKDDVLREKTFELKEIMSTNLKKREEKIAELTKRLDAASYLTPQEVEKLYKDLQHAKKKYYQKLEEISFECLPKAFAIVKETARRFAENKQLVVTATDYDREMAAKYPYVTIQGDQAIWSNTWEVMGQPITWNMVHYNVQLMGGFMLHWGRIVEMATGEGKTLVATLPVFLNALAGKGVHVVTVNEYLAKRDAAWNRPIFQFHCLSVACIDETRPYSQERKAAYQADITYGTNNEFGFDYLRDNMATSADELVQREHFYAIIDEVDSVLIDDARTPLIISGPVLKSNEEDYINLNKRIQILYEEQKKLVNNFIQEAKSDYAANKAQEAGLSLFRAFRGLPKYKPLIKYLSEPGVKQRLHKTENYYLQDNSRLMPEADEPLLFTIDEKNNAVELTEKGLAYITKQDEEANFFILPDTPTIIAQIDNDPHLSVEEKEQKRQALAEEYTLKSQRIHALQQLLKAYTLFEKDVDYIIVNGKVKIVDEQTGRVLEGRRYSDGLHQAIEAKEGVKIEKASQTYATITLQNYFRLYRKIAGMTGTAETEASEFYDIYKREVIVLPPNKELVREDKNDKVYKTAREKYNAIIEEIIDLVAKGRPVLVGTTSVENSELISKMLTLRKIEHQVLNAKQNQHEAEIIAAAGKPGTVTIATNMAGRGTDIKLDPESKKAGGLAIIGTERHESRRVDRQLRGRAGRQGDVGSSQFFVSLEDYLMRLFISDRIAKIMDRLGLKDGEMIQHKMVTRSIERAQKKVEQNNYAYRKRLLEYDNELNKQRTIVYNRRRNVLMGKHLHAEIFRTMFAIAKHITVQLDLKDNQAALVSKFTQLGVALPDNLETIIHCRNKKQIINYLYDALLASYDQKIEHIKNIAKQIQNNNLTEQLTELNAAYLAISFTDGNQVLEGSVKIEDFVADAGEAILQALAKVTILHYLDLSWQEHLRIMDDLRQSVQNAYYEQKDPLLIYKFESYNLFATMVARTNESILAYLLKSNLLTSKPIEEALPSTDIIHKQVLAEKKAKFSLINEDTEEEADIEEKKAINKLQPIISEKIAHRNDRITVRYANGEIKENIKFKNVEEDIKEGKCTIV